jgi:hypothetical protein
MGRGGNAVKKIREVKAITELALSKDEDALGEACDGGYSWGHSQENDDWENGQDAAASFNSGFKVAMMAGKRDVFSVTSEYDCWMFVGTKAEVIKRLKALPDKEKEEDDEDEEDKD